MHAPTDAVADQAGPPRLSVLVPAWNAESTIERALDSALLGHGVPIECVVVDDGSTDATSELVERRQATDPRVVLVRLPSNAGASAARNAGLEAIRGEWLTFLDADDRLLPGAVGALMAPTGNPAVRAVVGQRVWSDGERTWISRLYDIPDIREPGRKSLVTHPGLLYYASATGKAFHRSLFDGLRFRGRVLGDQPWTIRALLRAGAGIAVIDTDVYEWSRPPAGGGSTITAMTRSSAGRSAESARIAREAYREVCEEVDRQVPDPDGRLVVKRAYAERLARSDFHAALESAMERQDPATDRFLDALAELVEAMPAPVVATSDVLARSLLRPGWDHWPALSAAARSSYWRLLDAVARTDPDYGARVLGSRRLRRMVPLARRLAAVSPALAGVLVRGVRAAQAARRAVRRRVGR